MSTKADPFGCEKTLATQLGTVSYYDLNELEKQGRDPRDAWAFTERICGVCTTVHAIASVRAVEDALGWSVTRVPALPEDLLLAAERQAGVD